jgi:hypothetical protein
MIFYLKDSKNFTKKLLDIINKVRNIERKNVSLQKSVAFLYTNNEQSEKEYTKSILFKIASKKKYLGTILTKDVEDLYSENYKPLKKTI